MLKPTTIALAISVLMSVASADAGDPRCNAPPYGGTDAAFHALVNAWGDIINIVPMLTEICNEKFGGAPRTPLYTLGLTDQQIDGKSTEELALDTIQAAHDLYKRHPY